MPEATAKIKRTGCIALACLLLPLCLLSCQSSHRPPWAARPASLLYGFYVYADPAIKEDWKLEVASKALLRERLIELYFPAYQAGPLHIILYQKGSLYKHSAYVRKHPQVRAYFVRSSRSIHMPMYSSNRLWVHELSHALLHSVRNDAPDWLHEGLAEFLAERSHFYTMDCAQSYPISIPQKKRLRSARYSYQEVSAFFDQPNKLTYKSYTLYSLFIYYLWHQRCLGSFLFHYQNDRQSDAIGLLRQFLGRDKQGILKDFHQWLQTRAPAARDLAGC